MKYFPIPHKRFEIFYGVFSNIFRQNCLLYMVMITSGNIDHFFCENEVPYHFGILRMSTFWTYKGILTKTNSIYVKRTKVSKLFLNQTLYKSFYALY